MKTLRFPLFLITLVSALTFSSCLDGEDSQYGNVFRAYVTITGSSSTGYQFHADNGSLLLPTNESINSVLPGLAGSKAERAYVAFILLNDDSTYLLEEGKTYTIELVSDYIANYSIPTQKTINITDNQAAADTLIANNGHINYIDNAIWAANGYVNATLNLPYEANKAFYLNTYYDSEKDIDKVNKTLTLNIYYNSNTENPTNKGQSVFSFRLPEEVAHTFSTDSISLILKAKIGKENTELKDSVTCRIAVKNLYKPQ